MTHHSWNDSLDKAYIVYIVYTVASERAASHAMPTQGDRSMEKYTAKEAREQFSAVIAKAAHGPQRIIITKNGQDAVAVVPISDLEILAEIERVIDLHDARIALDEAKTSGTVSLDKLKTILGL